MELFFDYPLEEHHFRAIVRYNKSSPNTIQKQLAEWQQEQLIQFSGKKGNLMLYRANRESTHFIQKKRLYNLTKLLESPLMNLLEKIDPECVILFGSYLYGTDTSESDIDIAIISEKKEEISQNRLKALEKHLKRKISIHVINLQETEQELKNNLINGFVLYGYLKTP